MSGNLILVIEDDNSLSKILQDKLRVEGLNTIAVLNGSLGVHKAKTEKPDLILLDMMLSGGMSGFEVLEQLSKDPNTTHIPVVMLTNLDMEEKLAKDYGVMDYFVKSNTDLDDVCKRIKEILSNRSNQK